MSGPLETGVFLATVVLLAAGLALTFHDPGRPRIGIRLLLVVVAVAAVAAAARRG